MAVSVDQYGKALVASGLMTAEGLPFAHGEGVIHRDIKPANLRAAALGNAPPPAVFPFDAATALRHAGRLSSTGYTKRGVPFNSNESPRRGRRIKKPGPGISACRSNSRTAWG